MRRLLLFVIVTGMALNASAEREIRKEVLVTASEAEVWDAWTTPEGAQKFFAPQAKIELKPGGAYELYFRPEAPEGKKGSEGCVVVDIQPFRKLKYTWIAPPELPEVRDERTQVTIELEPVGKHQVKVRLTHSGWGSGGQWDQAYDYFDKAWGVVLARLQYRFATGPIDWNNPYRP